MNQDRLAARLRATFAAELADQVLVMNRDLLALEAAPGDGERLKSIFRVAHTLKGAARTADVPPVEELCHSLESLLAETRDGSRVLAAPDFHLLFAAADALSSAGERLGAARQVDAPVLVELARRLRAAPSAVRPADVPAPAVPPRAEPARDERVRVDPERLDALLAASSQLLIAGDRLAGRPDEVGSLHDAAKDLLAGWRRGRRKIRRGRDLPGAPLSPDLVEWVDARLAELVQQTRRLAGTAAGDARVLGQVTGDVLDQVKRLRVRPFSDACEGLPRAARDLAAAAGKEVELEISDGGVEADRAVLDGLRGALLQLLRNAIDHGIEPPARRQQLGKPAKGRLTVSAEIRGDRLVVVFADDGAGLDESSIRAKLAARGVPDPPGRSELVGALLQGGTSTRAVAGEISGRGVGLDIVRAAVERMHGRLEVDWNSGRGTTFTVVCPPSPAGIRVMLVRAGDQVVALPTSDIAAAAIVHSSAVRRVGGRDTIPTSDGPVQVIGMASLLGPSFTGRPGDGKNSVVVIRSGPRRLALAVDELLTEQEIVLRPIPGREGRFPLLSGAALMASGRVALVLDAASVLAAAAVERPAMEPLVPAADPGRRRWRILVVEDSITTRTLEQSLLEAAGYEVATAVDGADGLRWLQEHKCDLVVADLEMPRMDGLALCRAVRSSPHTKQLPFVLVTARESAEDRARGLEAGADAYLGKSSFDQRDLLETIRQLVG